VDLRLTLRTALRPPGDFRRVLALLREAESLAVVLDDARRRGQVSFLLSNYFYYIGAHDQAITAAQHALMLAAAGGAILLQAEANFYLGVSILARSFSLP
jgi:hypothetical protein